MKKHLNFLMLVIFHFLVIVAFVSCGQGSNSLKIALDIEDEGRYDSLFADYLELTGVEVTATYGEDVSKLIGTKDEPDIIKTSTVIIDSMKDSLMDLTGFIDADDEISTDDYIDSLIEALTIDGKVYALPTSINTSLLYYNKALFDEKAEELRAAFELSESESVYPKADWTYQDYQTAGLVLTEYQQVGDELVYSQFGADTQLRWWGEWLIYLYHFGGTFYEADSNNHRVALTTDEAIAATEFFVKKSMGGPEEKFAPDAIELSSNFSFVSGNIAMIFGGHMGDWYSYDTLGLDWDIQVLPTPEDNLNASGGEISADAFGISVRSKNKDIAFDFLKLWTGETGAIKLYGNGKIGALKNMEELILSLPEEDQLDINISAVFNAIDLAMTLPKEKDFSKVMREMVMTEIYKLMYEGRGSETDVLKVLQGIKTNVDGYYQGLYG
jgi:ABC-type glycerol-3-phosphate transport system substrate-binding protein